MANKNKLTLEQIRQKMNEEAAQETQRAAEIEATRENISSLEKQIEDAVDLGNVKQVESLEEQLVREQTHLATLERFNARKLDPKRYKSEAIEVCAGKMAELQPAADKACEEVKKAEKILLEKKVALVKILKEAADIRMNCIALGGVNSTWEPNQADEFDAVEFENLKTEVAGYEEALVLQLDPNFFVERQDARVYLRNKQPAQRLDGINWK